MPPSTFTPPAAASLLTLALCGCGLLGVPQQQRALAVFGTVSGTVHTEGAGPTDAPLVVALLQLDGAEWTIIDRIATSDPGHFTFEVEAGRYAIAAFQDRNRDLVFQLDEPVEVPDATTAFRIGAGDGRKGLDVLIRAGVRAPVDAPIDLREVGPMTEVGMHRSLGQFLARGDIIDITDKRYGPKAGQLGLWKPANFMLDGLAGIYWLEPPDPARTPVLFVHGISGYPHEFDSLIGNLDQARYQPVFYFYPSGWKLRDLATGLADLMAEQQLLHGLSEGAMVAHSMGGLVGRAAILAHWNATGRNLVRTFVTLSTPWGGHAAADAAVKTAPIVIDAWRDIAPGSTFLNEIFELPLPPGVEFHLLFGYRRNSVRMGASSDAVIPMTSLLRPAAQAEAISTWGFDRTHTDVLDDRAAADRINSILGRADGALY